MKDSANSLVCLAFGWFAIKGIFCNTWLFPCLKFCQVVARRPLPGPYRCVFWFAIKEREFFATLRLVIPLSQILPIADFASGGQTPPSRLLSTLRLVIPLSQILPNADFAGGGQTPPGYSPVSNFADRRFRKWWPDAPFQALIGAFFGLL